MKRNPSKIRANAKQQKRFLLIIKDVFFEQSKKIFFRLKTTIWYASLITIVQEIIQGTDNDCLLAVGTAGDRSSAKIFLICLFVCLESRRREKVEFSTFPGNMAGSRQPKIEAKLAPNTFEYNQFH